MNPKQIFIAEDDAASRELLTELLGLWGYEIRAFQDGAALLEGLEDAEPDLFILDIQMPRLSGIATVQRIRQSERWKSTPALALTAFAMSTDEERILNSGFDGYVTKPISGSELRTTIEKILSSDRT